MKLEIMSISFLRSGALSIEVGAQTHQDSPAEPFVDVLKVWVYMPSYNKADTMQTIIDNALRMAAQTVK
jgi:hypothetical protein